MYRYMYMYSFLVVADVILLFVADLITTVTTSPGSLIKFFFAQVIERHQTHHAPLFNLEWSDTPPLPHQAALYPQPVTLGPHPIPLPPLRELQTPY